MIYDVLNPGNGLTGIAADGVTDDSTNLQLIINNANIQGGGDVIFPPEKTIILGTPISLKSNVNLISRGSRTVLKAIDINEDGIIDPITGELTKDISSIITTFGGTPGVRKNIRISGFEFAVSLSGETPIIPGDFGLDFINQAIAINNAENIVIEKCLIENFPTFSAIKVTNTKNITIKDCIFKNSSAGINFDFQNNNVKVNDNIFEFLSGHGIHFQGSATNNAYSSDIWITRNRITIGSEDVHGIYFTCGDTQFNLSAPHHENVVVADNIITGPEGLSNANGGTADLFSLKDIIRLKCYGNTARNSGDLGYAIERCHGGLVSNNTADKNNSCGISIYGSSNMSVTGNVCSHNEQNHDLDRTTGDGGLGSKPYGGIRVEFDSIHILLSGNHFFGTGNDPLTATQSYGIVVKSADLTGEITNNPIRSPYNIKIGINHYVDHSLGDIYNAVTSTIIEDSSATVVTVTPTP